MYGSVFVEEGLSPSNLDFSYLGNIVG